MFWLSAYGARMMVLFLLACQPQMSEWWQDEDANPYPLSSESEEGEDIGEGEEAGFFGLITESDMGYIGENAVEASGCMWYIDITGEEVEPCAECSFAVQITFEDAHIEESDDCPEGFHPEDYIDTSPIIGFGNGYAWIQEEEDWEEFALYFKEDVYHIWFVSF